MKLRNACRIVSVVTLGVPLLIGTARAGDGYSQSIIPAPAKGGDGSDVNTSDFLIKYPGGNKLVVKPATVKHAGDGMTTQLILNNVSCANEGNDKPLPAPKITYKCGVSGQPVPAVIDMSVHQFMTPGVVYPPQYLGPDIMHVAGIPIQLEKGKAVFVATGTNKVTSPQVFGALADQTLGQPLGIGSVAIKTQGSVPTDCAYAPPGAGCLDGTEFGFAGIMVGP